MQIILIIAYNNNSVIAIQSCITEYSADLIEDKFLHSYFLMHDKNGNKKMVKPDNVKWELMKF